MNPEILLKTAPETGDYEVVDLTDRAELVELSPIDNDVKLTDYLGFVARTRRTMQRLIRVDKIVGLTDAQVQTLRRWKHERRRITLNGNYNSQTIFLNRFSRSDPADFNPGVQIGSKPTFSRSSGGTTTKATREDRSGLLHLLDHNVPRYEYSSLNIVDRGIRTHGATSQYFGKTEPQSGDLLWTLTNPSGLATWAWDANAQPIIQDLDPGCGLFSGQNGDYLQCTLASAGSPARHSASVYVRGEGTFSFYISGVSGGPYETQTILQPGVWKRFVIENLLKTSTFYFRIYSKQDKSWCHVSSRHLVGNAVVGNQIYNMDGTAQSMSADRIRYDNDHLGHFEKTYYFGFAKPQFVTYSKQTLFSMDHGGGNQSLFEYRSAAGKYYFQQKTFGKFVTWSPLVVISDAVVVVAIHVSRDNFWAYENGAYAASELVTDLLSDLNKGFTLGVNENELEYGWFGMLYFVRVDKGAFNTGEVTRVYNLWGGDPATTYWRQITEGREFEIETPLHKIRGGLHNTKLTLREVRSDITATTEDY